MTESTDPAKTTPNKWSSPKDARDEKEAGQYPNYWTHKTRSGHVFTLDDSKDGEHITLQHRGGSMIQFRPDGAVQFVSHNGQYNFVFGENRVKITGAYDVTVEGGGSLKVDGNYNVTVKGDVNMTTDKAFNVTAKSANYTIADNMDIQAKNVTQKIEGNMATQVNGNYALSADGPIGIKSTGDSLGLKASKQMGLVSGTELAMESGSKASIKGTTLALNSDGEVGVTGASTISIYGSETKLQTSQGPQHTPVSSLVMTPKAVPAKEAAPTTRA